jgi:uncharacterized protein
VALSDDAPVERELAERELADNQPAEGVGHRLVGPDVTRALALIGVVVMNYHGYLNGADAAAQPGDSLANRVFDPWHGILSTRFAATFMLVAGMGVALLTRRSNASCDRAALAVDRWRLIRRGAVLYGAGFLLDWIWPGTILFYYGAAFMIAGVVFHWRTRWIITLGTVAAVSAAVVNWWAVARSVDGNPPIWLLSPNTLDTRSPRGLLLDTFVNGTHPMLPWLAFLCTGIVVGRHIRHLPLLRTAAVGAAVVAITYAISHLVTNGHGHDPVRVAVFSTSPFDRGFLYTLNALGSAVFVLCVVSWLAERRPHAMAVRVLQVTGQTTLSLYVLHVFVFNTLVHRWHWIRPTGLDTALVFAFAFWLAAIGLSWMWHTRFGQGPLERVYRRFGG